MLGLRALRGGQPRRNKVSVDKKEKDTGRVPSESPIIAFCAFYCLLGRLSLPRLINLIEHAAVAEMRRLGFFSSRRISRPL